MKKIENEAILSEIAKSDDDKFVRIEAIKGINDEKILADISQHDEDSFVRSEAVKYINSLEDLAYVAISDSNLIVAKNALNKIISKSENEDIKDTLGKIATIARDEEIRNLAISEIDDDETTNEDN